VSDAPAITNADLFAAVKDAFQHTARGCRSAKSHDPFVYEVGFDAALARLRARLEAAERVAEALEELMGDIDETEGVVAVDEDAFMETWNAALGALRAAKEAKAYER